MMRVTTKAEAGVPDKKGDVWVAVEPCEQGAGTVINIKSSMIREFGKDMEATVRELLTQYQVTDAIVTVVDKGAMDFALRARLETALRRSGVGGIL